MKRRPQFLVILAALVAVFTGTFVTSEPVAHADPYGACTIAWDGGAGTPWWLDAANWTGDRLPTYADDACVSQDSAPPTGITLSGASNQTVNSLRIDASLRVDMAADAGLRLVGPSTTYNLYIDSGYLEADYTLLTAGVIQTGGALGGSANIQVNGGYYWSGGQMWGTGWTTIESSSNGTYGLYISGGGELSLDQRALTSHYGMRWSDDTTVTLSNGGYLRTFETSVIEAPGALITGDGTFDNSGGIYVAADAEVAVTVPYRTVDNGWWSLADMSGLTLSGTSVVDGDVHLVPRSQLTINGDVRFTTASEITGGGILATEDDAANLVAEGKVEVASLAPSAGFMTFENDLVVDDVDALGGVLHMDNGANVQAATWSQYEADFVGSAHVTGNAAVEAGSISGSTAGAETFVVDGGLVLADEVAFDSIDVKAGNLTFTTSEDDESVNPFLYLTGDAAAVDVAGTVTSAVDTTVATPDSATDSAFHAAVIAVTDNEFVLGAPTTVGPDDTVTVAENAVLRLSSLVQRGTMTISGGLALTDEVKIESDIDAVGELAEIGFDEHSIVDLVGGAAVGGTQASIGNAGWLAGEGSLIGNVVNGGLIETDATIDVVGHYEQTTDGAIHVHVNGAHHGSIDVVGDAVLDGGLTMEVDEGADFPSDDFDVVTATGVIEGTFAELDGIDHCASLTYGTHAVTVSPRPCVVVEAGQAQEDAGHMDFAVYLSKPSTRPVVVHYGLIPGTADITDYVDEPGQSLTIPAGETVAAISVGLTDDEDEEQDETFTLSYTVEGGEAEAAEAIGTIIDDDVKLDYAVQSIPVPNVMRWISGLGTEYVVGTVSADADTMEGWAYRISKDAFGPTRGNFMGNGLNAADQAVGDCGSSACMRDHLVDTTLSQPSGTAGSAAAIAISDTGEIVGYIARWGGGVSYTPARWADANSAYEEFTALGGGHEQAIDVNNHGVIVGNSKFGDGSSRGWVRYPDGSVVDVGTLFGLPDVHVVGISDDGVVAGFVSDGQLWSQTFYGFTWTPEGGMTSLGAQSLVMDIARNGDMTGHINARSVLWRDGRAIDLNKALDLDPTDGFILTSGMLINDQGTIVSLGSYRGFEVVVALVPDGAGCIVCLDGHLYEHEFPTGTLIDAGDTIVEGNPTELFADLANHDEVARTVTVSFVGPDGQPLDDPRTFTIPPNSTQNTFISFDTEGLAWKDGTDAGPMTVGIEMRDAAGNIVDSESFETRIVPRPVVNVHGMNSDASTWAGYPAFVSNAHVGWQAFAVDTMNTKPWIPNTIAQNAALLDTYITKVQTEQNAWQVDLVAHSMGGLISRYYIQNLMRDHDAIRPARQLVMLGTPNAGSPCADLFAVPMTTELRTDLMRIFNAVVNDRKGVPFSIAAGDPWVATCDQIGPGDMVVPLDSALHGVSDSEVFPIVHTDMTFSQQLFSDFVLPRLNGQHQVAAARAANGFGAAAADAPEAHQPQLIQTDRETVAPGATEDITIPFVTAGLGAVGVTALGSGSLEVALVRNGVVVATSGVDTNPGALFRTVSAADPATGTWKLRLINHGTTSLDVPLSVWVQGAANTLEAQAEQVNILGKVRVTARITGPALSRTIDHLMIATVDRDGDKISGPIYDNGTDGDAVAGDGIYTGSMPNVKQGPAVIQISTDDASFWRQTTVGLVISVGTDGPGNDAPVAMPATVTVPGGEQTRIDLEAADPEGADLTYHIVDQPAHGKLGGGGPFYYYVPTAGYMGSDSFTYRVHDGELYSATVTVTITVGRANAIVDFRYPSPPAATKGSQMHVVALLKGVSGEAVTGGGDITLTFGDAVVTTTVGSSGLIEVDVPVTVASGRRDLVFRFAGNAKYAPTTYTQGINVTEGVAPVPNLLTYSAEAGYTTRFFATSGDADNDAVRFQFDFTDDGVFDAELGAGFSQYVDFVFPAAFEGRARVRVTDAAGHVADAVADVHIAAHRDLGALQRILVDGQPVQLLDVSDDGRYVLYAVTDHEDGHALPVPYGVLDRQTGTSTIVSVRPDGVVDDFPSGGVISPDGRTVAFGSGEYVNGFYAPQVYVRNLDTGVTVLASVNAAGQRGDRGAWPLAVTNGGTKILFQSSAMNLAPYDVRQCGTAGFPQTACEQLYMRDLTAGITTIVSDRVGTTVASIESGANMSADGRYVAYGSRRLLWFVDTETGARESLPFGNGQAGDRYGTAEYLAVSDDGRSVTFTTEAGNVLAGDDNSAPDLVRYDRQTGTTTVLVEALDGGFPHNGSSFGSIDACGTRTVFWTESAEIVAGDTNGQPDVFLREANGEIRRLSVEARDGIQSDRYSAPSPLLTGNGRFVFFQSEASNLVPGDVEFYRDTFVLDLGDTTSCGDTPPPPANRAPSATAAGAATDEDVAVAVTLAGTDLDGDPLTVAVVDGPAHGTLSGTGADRTYTPVANWSGSDSLTFTVSDGALVSEPATVTITVRPVNDAPVAVLAAPAAIDEGATGTLTLVANDVDGDPLTYTWTTDGGTLVPSAGGTSASLAGGDGPATRHVTVKVSDGTTYVTAVKDVSVINVAPSVTIVRPTAGAHIVVGTVVELSAAPADAGGDAVSCSVDWGDGAAPSSGCVASHTYATTGTFQVAVTGDDGDGGTATARTSVVVDAVPTSSWTFDGFFQPVDNLPTVNTVKAGSTVPLKFSLGGDRGLAIFAPGYPASVAHPCGTASAEDAIEQVATPGESTLTYDAGSDRYHYNWKTEKSWSGQCRTLVVKFVDGTVARAEFKFK
jgi:hypothetical protein